MLHIPPTSLFLLAAKQKPDKKTLLTRNIEKFLEKSSGECLVLIYSVIHNATLS